MAPDQEGVIEHLEGRWQRVGDLVGLRNLPEFVRHYLTSTRGLTRSEYLFRVIKGQLQRPEDAVDFLDTLVKEAEIYQALQDPDAELWEDSEKQQQALKFLELLSIKQVLPVLLAAHRKAEKNRLSGITSALAVFLFRFGSVGQRRNNEMEAVLARLALAFHQGEIKNVSGVRRVLAPLYPSDEQFRSDFSNWSIAATGPKKRLAKFVLSELEATANQTEAKFDPGTLTLEHILPVSQGHSGWENRFGNYALLEKELNREASAAPWEQRRTVYARSNQTLTREVAGERWSIEEIHLRQMRLAQLAVQRFQLPPEN